MTKLHFLIVTGFSIALLNSVDLSLPYSESTAWINLESQAQARSSGGRSGGGSFSRGSSGSRSSGSRSSGSSSPSRPSSGFGSSGNRSYDVPSNNRRSGGGSVYPVYPSYNNYGNRSYSSYRSGNPQIGLFLLLLFMGLGGLLIFAIIFSLLKTMMIARSPNQVSNQGDRERDNHIVTLSKLQVALSAKATGVQKQLSQLSWLADTDTPAGLLALLQESALILLRHSEYWTHVLSSSQSISIDKAQQAFNQLSLAERSKFNTETLTNVNGKLIQQEIITTEDEDAAYIVVTLLVGTAHDHALFEQIRSTEALKTALEQLASIPTDYLMTFELLWSPQDEKDSLTYDELLTEYTDMMQLV